MEKEIRYKLGYRKFSWLSTPFKMSGGLDMKKMFSVWVFILLCLAGCSGEDVAGETDATTTADIASKLGDSKNVTLQITEKITDVTVPITLPRDVRKVALNFAQVPVTALQSPLKIEETSAAKGAELNINIPTSDTADSYLELDVPNITVNVEGGNYKKIVAHTAVNTLILGAGVKVEELVIKGGNVMLKGAMVLNKILREANSDDVTYVYLSNGSKLESGIIDDKKIVDVAYQIRYTTADGRLAAPGCADIKAEMGANLVSNTYEDGVGIMEFDGPITAIGYQAFYERENLTSIEIPNSVTSIGTRAFMRNYNLRKVTMPKGLVTIGEMAFYWCQSLTEVTIHENVKSIDKLAFAGALALRKIYCMPVTPPVLGENAIISGFSDIYVPAANFDTYKASWSFKIIAVEED